MPPRRSRHRARRRSPARPVILLIAAVVVLALLVGGLTQVSRQSQGYDANSDRTLAAQGIVAADQSNDTAATVRSLLGQLPSESRQGLQATLDGVVQQTGAQAARAQLAAGATPLGTTAAQFVTVFADRAQAMTQLRSAVYGYLGMQPVAPADTPASGTASSSATAPLLSVTETTNRIAAAGALLTRSDALYRTVQRTLSADPGHGRLPASVWVTDPQLWQAGSVAAQVDLLATSPSLATTHYVLLRTTRLSPPALPTPPGAPANVSVISPTSHVGVSEVVANQGSANEPHIAVQFSLANRATGAATSQVRTTALAAGASVTLPAVTFRVKPSTAYVLSVQITLPPGQTLTVGTVAEVGLQVAPGT